ncbi:hypothetical protein [Nocardioides terrisoli]|uniref:hypothetical protein n=1 Tax=Nocardioides terrisoli TaxID=3388267 RepID=UPI00287BB0EA|nr:hypothetical protein [Nocardioides marmorisolisilvae]
MTGAPPRHGLGDPRIPWNVLLDARTTTPPESGSVRRRLQALARRERWPEPALDAVAAGEAPALLASLSARLAPEEPLDVAVHADGLVLRGDHRVLDGLSLLSVLGELIGAPAASAARGIAPADRDAPLLPAVVDRLTEVLVRPSARVAPSRRSRAAGRPSPDVFARRTVDAPLSTADLVRAGALAVRAWNAHRGGRSARISVAVGVTLTGSGARHLGDHSGFLRLRDVERLSRDEVAVALRTAPLQPSRAPGNGPLTTVVGAATRLAAPRLGSTLLVSHLGRVHAPGVEDIAFYPVSGGGSGLSLGAATVADRTVVTLRARGRDHDHDGLEQLLEAVAGQLGG